MQRNDRQRRESRGHQGDLGSDYGGGFDTLRNQRPFDERWDEDGGGSQAPPPREARWQASARSGRWGAEEPGYGRQWPERPPEYGYDRPNRHGPQYEEGGRYPGSRPLNQDEWLGSRSADPGQGSYGGFRGEDPGYQRQDLRSTRERGARASGAGDEGALGYWGGQPDDGTRGARIDPKGYTRSDERVREMVCERLAHSGLDVSDVEVSVSDGQVTLQGTVPDRRTKHAVEDCVDDCAGVKEIENRVRCASRASRR
ncbi:BON domain-containing protein [Bordetella hinzii]|uniref:BON domain-containing protein n=1 Tax=Bordetella hinzii TaxID=103855 RepID=UPI0039FBF863|nr:BON domain-containing protein [Bordetella hinzii]